LKAARQSVKRVSGARLGRPASLVLTPEEWEAHRRQLADVAAWAASLYAKEQAE